MSIFLRIALLVVSILTLAYVSRKLRKSQMKVEDTLFWILLSIALVIIGSFPSITYKAAELFGVQSPVNFVYLAIIFVLLMKMFLLSIKISRLENKMDSFIQEMAIREKR